MSSHLTELHGVFYSLQQKRTYGQRVAARCVAMLRRCAAALAAKKIPNPRSSLLNPRSYRAKVRRAAAIGEQQKMQFEAQAMFAEIGGTSPASSATPARSAKSRRQRRNHHVRRVVGKDIAERAKAMTDAEWESIPIEEKHAFTKYMGELLREHPTEATEQQRRRYFETTMMDPRDLDPNRTVQDEYERLKMGLPVQLKNPKRSLGVSQAIADTGDATLFDPDKVDALEETMQQIKQIFADYVRQRKEGASTETARRKLSNMLADLNVETQRHLSHMFKYAEEKVRHEARVERERQLNELQRLRRLVASPSTVRRRSSASSHSQTEPVVSEYTEANVSSSDKDTSTSASPSDPEKVSSEGDANPSSDSSRLASLPPALLVRTKRRSVLKRSLSKAMGLEVEVVESLITELEAQEKFMEFCEVFARLTVSKGFRHSPEDEGLDAYTESLRKLYSVDANKLSTLDVVQYLAAKEDAHPVDWAKRWYERLVRIPLERTPEFRRLEEIREGDKAALELRAQETENAARTRAASPGHEAAKDAEKAAATGRTQQAVRLVEKMFMRPDDPRLKSLQEKRLRYIAYLQMERQIMRARENAKLFDGVEDTAEANECRQLYTRLMERKNQCSVVNADVKAPSPSNAEGRTSSNENSSGSFNAEANVETNSDINIFQLDAEAAALFEQISRITQTVIQKYRRESRRRSKAVAKAEVLARVIGHVGTGARTQNLQQLLQEKKNKVAQRLLSVLEDDVKSDMEWLDAMEEAERPPLLPVPEGMSYISAADVQAWKDVREADKALSADPFRKHKKQFQPTLFGQPWQLPDKPLLFWGTGTRAVQQALEHAADDAERWRRDQPLAPPYPCPENPWGWRLVKDILDD